MINDCHEAKNATKLDFVKIHKSYPKESVLPEGVLYRYLHQLDEQHGSQKRRTADFIWSKNMYKLDQVVEEPGNRVLCYLLNDKAIVRQEFMHTPENSQVLPELINKWK